MVTFLYDRDFELYLDIMAEWCVRAEVEVWAYCLMPNHVHLIVVPKTKTSLSIALREAHGRYSTLINRREGWRGHLWQARFHSFPMNDRHLYAATRYVELNPVRAGLVESPYDWRWSSANAHLWGVDDRLVKVAPLLKLWPDWSAFLAGDGDGVEDAQIRQHASSGRPMGDPEFVKRLEEQTGRILVPRPAGRRQIRMADSTDEVDASTVA